MLGITSPARTACSHRPWLKRITSLAHITNIFPLLQHCEYRHRDLTLTVDTAPLPVRSSGLGNFITSGTFIGTKFSAFFKHNSKAGRAAKSLPRLGALLETDKHVEHFRGLRSGVAVLFHGNSSSVSLLNRFLARTEFYWICSYSDSITFVRSSSSLVTSSSLTG